MAVGKWSLPKCPHFNSQSNNEYSKLAILYLYVPIKKQHLGHGDVCVSLLCLHLHVTPTSFMVIIYLVHKLISIRVKHFGNKLK